MGGLVITKCDKAVAAVINAKVNLDIAEEDQQFGRLRHYQNGIQL